MNTTTNLSQQALDAQKSKSEILPFNGPFSEDYILCVLDDRQCFLPNQKSKDFLQQVFFEQKKFVKKNDVKRLCPVVLKMPFLNTELIYRAF